MKQGYYLDEISSKTCHTSRQALGPHCDVKNTSFHIPGVFIMKQYRFPSIAL